MAARSWSSGPPRLRDAANWKILAENYHECYHCSSIHPELCQVSPPTSGGDNLEPEGAWVGGPMGLYEGVETMSLDGKSLAPNLPHLAEGQDRRSTTSSSSRTSS